MILIRHRHRGAVPRKLKKATNAATKIGLREGVEFFHEELRDRRFTKAHARAAGYWSRRPEYTKRKKRQMGHDRPLEWEGNVRDALETGRRFVATSKSARVVYSGGRGFNRRHKNSPINMREEFERILPEESEQFAEILDKRLQIELGAPTAGE